MGCARPGRCSLIVLPDVNVLVYAFRRESPHHDGYAAWLAELAGGGGELALGESTVVGFLRIVTNRRIYADPAPTAVAVAFVDALLGASRQRWVDPTRAVWAKFRQLVGVDGAVRGSLVPDAWLAALAISHGCHLATADRGFARFPDLHWFDPAGAE